MNALMLYSMSVQKKACGMYGKNEKIRANDMILR